MTQYSPHRLSVAPMMDWTDRHCRYFHRLLTKNTLLYTESTLQPRTISRPAVWPSFGSEAPALSATGSSASGWADRSAAGGRRRQAVGLQAAPDRIELMQKL